MVRLRERATATRVTIARWVSVFHTSLATIVGGPNYDRYLDHVRRAHPGLRPLTRNEFCQRHLDGRYNRPGGRCC
jgi:uncharacterized short protein YbdD (DUF466 family)